MSVAIKLEDASKLYRLGQVGTVTVAHDFNRWLHRIRGKADPYAQLGQLNDRTQPAGGTASQEDQAASNHEYVWALKDIDLEVKQGEILGIIGRNGAGKSTLLKLLSRVTAPTTGVIKTRGRIASLLEVGTGFHPELTGRENVYLNGAILGMKRPEITKQLDAIVDFSGCAKYLDTPVKRYSSGMMVRLGFAVAAHLQCEILIVDEVLAVGDWEFQKQCLQKMDGISANQGRTVLFVSHNMGSINRLCSKCIIMEQGALVFNGDVTTATSRYLNYTRRNSVTFNSHTTNDFKFESLSTVDESGFNPEAFRFQDPIQFQIDINQPETIRSLEIGLRIHAHDGTTVFSAQRSHTDRSSIPAGKQTLMVTVPPQFLTPGSYSATVEAFVRNGRLIELREFAIQFRIEETGSPFAQNVGSDNGLVMCPCNWQILKSSPEECHL